MKEKVVFNCRSMLPGSIKTELKKMYDLRISPCNLTKEETLRTIRGADGIITCSDCMITQEIANEISPKWIIYFGTQPRTIFDDSCWNKFSKKVYPTSVVGLTIAETSENQIKSFLSEARGGKWDANIAIVGAGQIGQELMRRLFLRFSRVFYCGGRGEKVDLKKIGFRYLKLEKAFKISRVVSIHQKFIPKKTESLVQEKHLLSMPKNSLLLNNSRAGVVDFLGLKNALKLRSDIRVVFDSYYPGRDPSELSVYDNFIFTNHSATHSDEIYRECYKNLLKIIKDNNLS